MDALSRTTGTPKFRKRVRTVPLAGALVYGPSVIVDGMSRQPARSRPSLVSGHFLAVTLAVLLAPKAPLRADVIASTLVGPCCGGISLAGTAISGGVTEAAAMAFTPTATYKLTDVQMSVSEDPINFNDPTFSVSLFSSVPGSGGQVPGSLIASIETDLTAPVNWSVVTATGATPLLAAGTEYWIVLSPFDAGSEFSWEASTLQGLALGTLDGAAWTSTTVNTQQFAVDGVAVPEPAEWSLVAIGLAGVALVSRPLLSPGRRRTGHAGS